MSQTATGSLVKKGAGEADETRQFEGNGHLDVVKLGDHTIGIATFEPGFKWSDNVKPIVGTDSCQAPHLAYVVSGRMTIVSDDGSQVDVGPGDLVSVAPGHDAWTVGDEPCVQVDFMSGATYARK